MRKGAWLGALVALAATGAAGTAAAEDCTGGGFYTVCLFDERTATTYFWNGFSVVRTNTLASAEVPTSFGVARAGVAQSESQRVACNFVCADERREGTTAGASFTSGPDSLGADAGQRTGSTFFGAGTALYTEEETTVGVTLGTFRIAAGQVAYGGAWPSSCAYRVILGATIVPVAPCGAAGVEPRIPQLTRTCVATPAGPVCGKFPDWPDDTGLPFL